jgi:hypothetical protein
MARLSVEEVQKLKKLAEKKLNDPIFKGVLRIAETIEAQQQEIEQLKIKCDKLLAKLNESQRKERVAVAFIHELRSDDSGDWGDVMFMIDEWIEQHCIKGKE